MARQVRRAQARAFTTFVFLGGLSGLSCVSSAAASPTASHVTSVSTRAAVAAPDREAVGLVWEVRGPSGTVYLAGSMHLLRPEDARLPAGFELAYRESERLVMELDFDDLDPSAVAAFTATHATYPPGPGLRDALGERRWQRARDEFGRVGLQLDAFDRFEPWAAALVYSVAGMAQLGFDPASGVEEQLKARAASDRKEIAGLETLEFQLGLFDALSADDQARLLELTLDDARGSARDIDRLTAAWRSGDGAALAKLLLREYRRFPTLYEPLVYGRNRNWVPQVEMLLQREDDSLVVVGAMHLVGDQGLVELLRRRGLTVEPLRLH